MTTYNFPPTSRYYSVGTTTLTDANGRTITYLQRRFAPAPERFAEVQQHVVSQDERIDQIAAKYLGDPEAFWRICDANAAMLPQDLTKEPGTRLRITLPEGIPGLTDTGLG